MLCRMRGSRTAVLCVAAAVLLLVVVVARGKSAVPSSMTDPGLHRGLPALTLSGGDSPGGGGTYAVDDPALMGKIIIVLAGIMVVLALVLSVLSWLRQRRLRLGYVGGVAEQVDGTIDTVMRLRLRDAVQEASDLLSRPGGSPGDAVIQAWVTLESATDHTRAPHQTATEFTVSLLEKETTDEAALADLRDLYHRARFAHHSSEADATRAREALDRILATIR